MRRVVRLCAAVYAALALVVLAGCASQSVSQKEEDPASPASPYYGVSTFEEFTAMHPPAVQVVETPVVPRRDHLWRPSRLALVPYFSFEDEQSSAVTTATPLLSGEERIRPVEASTPMARAAALVNVPTIDQLIAMMARAATAETERLVADGAKRLVMRISALEADLADPLVYVGLTDRDGVTMAVFDRQTPNPIGQTRLNFDMDFCRVRLKYQLTIGRQAGGEQMMDAIRAIIKEDSK